MRILGRFRQRKRAIYPVRTRFCICFALFLAAIGCVISSSTAYADDVHVAEKLKACLLREHALVEEWRFEVSLDCFAREKRPCPMSDRSACEVAATATVEAEFRDALNVFYSDQLLNAGDRREDVQREQDYSRLLLRHLTERADLECQQYKEVEAYLGPLSSGDAQFVCNSYRSLRIAHFTLGRFDHHAVYKYIRKSGDE